jgi:3-hydroxyisobutyrate dehydrogenase-like beta-hydroxyacid dehydrogenase
VSQRFGFIGLGAMGAPMASRLLRQGHELVVHDVRPEAVARLTTIGAKAAASPADVASSTSTVFASLPTPQIVEQVVCGPNGVLEGKGAGIFVDFSTSGPQTAQRIFAAAANRRVTALDAPVSGGAIGAQNGTLSIMLSGPLAAAQAVKEPLLGLAKKVFYMGERPGMGQMMKLVNNLLSATSFAAGCEGMALGVKAGLDPELMLQVLNASTGRSNATEDKIPRAVVSRSFDLNFGLALSLKDIKLCIEAADDFGVPMWSGNAIKQLYQFALSESGATADMSAVARCYEEWSGVQIEKGAQPVPTLD